MTDPTDDKGSGADEVVVTIPMDMAQDLRQWAEQLAMKEYWSQGSHGNKVLRAYKELLNLATTPHDSEPEKVCCYPEPHAGGDGYCECECHDSEPEMQDGDSDE